MGRLFLFSALWQSTLKLPMSGPSSVLPRQVCIAVLFCAVGIPAILLSPETLAQEDAPDKQGSVPATADAGRTEPKVREIGTIITMRDKDGNLVHLPNADLENFGKFLIESGAPKDPGPTFHFTNDHRLTGKVVDGKAELELEYEVEVHQAGWVEIPLRLPNVHLKNATIVGSGKHYLVYHEASGGYVARIRAEPDSLHRIKLSVVAPISGTERERTLAIQLPEGIPSELNLTTSVAKATARVGVGCELLATQHDGKNTTFTIAQRGGDLVVTWAAPGQKTSRPSVFEVDGRILARWTATRVSWEAKFLINVRQGEVSQLQVLLPREARLSSSQDFPAQSIESEIVDEKTKISRVTIKFDQAIREGTPREVLLACERVLELNATNGDPIEIGQFEVMGAARHTGVLGIATSSDWRPIVTAGNDWLPELQTPDEFRAGGVLPENVYRYLSPGRLQMTVAERRSLVTVAPTHVLLVGNERLHLESRLTYRVVGTFRSRCRINMPGWTVESIELLEGNDIQAVGFEPFQTDPLEINLPNNIGNDFELRIVAHQTRVPDTDKIDARIPTIVADEPLSAHVVVQPDDDVLLTLAPDESLGLRSAPRIPEITLPEREQRPLYLRTIGAAEALLVANCTERPQEVSSQGKGVAIDLGPTRATFSQSLMLNITSRPLNGLALQAPGPVSDLRILSVLVDGEPVPFDWTLSADTTSIALPGSYQGIVEIQLRGEIDYPPLKSASAATIEVPLFHPERAQGRSGETSVRLNLASSLQATVEGHENQAGNAAQSDEADVRLASVKTPSLLKVSARALPPRQNKTQIVVQRAWLQTWLSHTARQDRAVFKLRTNGSAVMLDMPDKADLSRLVLLVDGKDRNPQFQQGRRLRIALPNPPASDLLAGANDAVEHVVELWWPSGDPPSEGEVEFLPPSIVEAWTQKLYWHVVLPRDRWAIASPPGFEEEMVASDWWWTRKPRMEQAALERWCGATPQASPSAGNQAGPYAEYLYVSLGRAENASLSTVSSPTVLALAGLGVLTFGLVLYYTRAARHPLVLGLCAAVVIYLALVWPAAAILIAKAVVLAAGLALGVKLTEQVFRQRPAARRRQANRTGREASSVRRGRRDVPQSLLTSSPSTTATAAASLPVSPSDAT